MATNKKRTEQARLAREQKKKMNQRVGIVVGILLLVVIAFFLYNTYAPKPAAPTPVAEATSADSSQPAANTGAAKQWQTAPEMSIDKNKQYFATVKMAKGGQFVIELFPKNAPITVNSFVFLARQGFYNGVTFHRVLEGFMAQGGDPTGTGSGGPGYQFVNEVGDLTFDKPGVVAMANAGPNTNGSQFFIMFVAGGLSEKDYTVFGQVTEGMDVVNAITRRDPQQDSLTPGDAMESVTITEK